LDALKGLRSIFQLGLDSHLLSRSIRPVLKDLGDLSIFSVLLIITTTISGASGAPELFVSFPTEVDAGEPNRCAVRVKEATSIPGASAVLNVTIPTGFSYPGGAKVIFAGLSSALEPVVDGGCLRWDISGILRAERTIVINEILPNPLDSDTGNERVELFNAGSSAIDLQGWYLKDRIGNTVSTLPSDKLIGDMLMAPGAFLVAKAKDLNNDGDDVILYNSSRVQRDFVSYGRLLEI
jgi:hypothetical protein